jgi:U3 small nucleolar RNA-associated protein 24
MVTERRLTVTSVDCLDVMGRAKKTRKFATVKKMLKKTDTRVTEAPAMEHQPLIKKVKKSLESDIKKNEDSLVRAIPQVSSAMIFAYNTNLKPPYQVLIDTNFLNFSIQNKLDVFKSLMDCLLAKTIPCVTDCVIAELEKLGSKYRLALRLAKDPRFTRLTCTHKGTYADDCLVERITQHRCYLVGTNDKDLKRRIRKIPGVPIVNVVRGKYTVERIPESISLIPQNKK